MFKLSAGNTKMHKLASMLGLSKAQVASADLPCGYTCPCANICKAFAHPETGKIIDGKDMKFRCYGASIECMYKSARALHWNNFNLVRDAETVGGMTDILLGAISPKIKILRVHSFGDFFNEVYFNAWVAVAEKLPSLSIFGYTKVLPYVKAPKPDNFALQYSHGGILDEYLTDEPTAYIVRSIAEAQAKGIELSCQNDPADDYNFILAKKSFGLLLHGTQPKTLHIGAFLVGRAAPPTNIRITLELPYTLDR
jgi:hypothetical protein